MQLVYNFHEYYFEPHAKELLRIDMDNFIYTIPNTSLSTAEATAKYRDQALAAAALQQMYAYGDFLCDNYEKMMGEC